MIIYQGTTDQFKKDVLNNCIADNMAAAYESSFGRKVQPSEYNSWSNSCQHVKNLVDIAGLKDNMICLEYEVPYNTGRIDCMLFGKGEDNKSYTILIELKQWSQVEVVEDEENFVETYTGGAPRKVPHPSQQVKGYHIHLVNFVQIYEINDDFDLYSCAYCHNYPKKPGKELFAERYNRIIDEFPLYTKEDVQKLAEKLKYLLAKGNGFEIFNRFMQSPVRPSKKLLESVSRIVEENREEFSLLNEQLVAKNVIMSKVRKADKTKTKSVIVVHGGPGTGKTVIALNLLAELAKMKKVVFYGCKSKPFRSALEKLVGKDNRILFSNLTRFIPSKVKEDEIDVVLIDEAHRIEKNSNSQYTKKEDRTDIPQVEQLIRCSKTTVFFIDDKQNVRSQEVGSSELIKETAEKYNTSYESVELISQFRCAGSDNYLDWLEYLFGYSKKPVRLSSEDNFEFKIVDNPNKLYAFIKKHEQEKANSARMVAGYCWPWSKKLNEDGSLIKDVSIPEYNFAMPWEAQDNYPSKLQKGIPKWYQWAYQTNGVEQVGCIYTAQGFEFDYIGVIVGKDLKYDSANDQLVADINATCDPTLKKYANNFESHVKNIYRVLMTRGMKGCYVYFCDKEVEQYFRKHVDGMIDFIDEVEITRSDGQYVFIEEDVDEHLKYTEYLPFYELEPACGYFGRGIPAENEGWIKVEGQRLARNMFVTKVHGKSMEPHIPDGSYCVFRTNVVGSRNNKTVLVQHSEIADPETGGRYSVKKYTSKKRFNDDGTWQHEEIHLIPHNNEYDPIIIKNADDEEFIVVGEFICTI